MVNCKSCYSICFDNCFGKWLMASCFVTWIKRFVPLMTSIWMEVDMAFDIRQSFIYFDHAFNANGTYAKWAYEYNKTINGKMETVHPGYFYTSIVVWILPRFLMSAFAFLLNLYQNEYNPFWMTKALVEEFSSFELNLPFKKRFQNILFFVFYLPCDLLISEIYTYIFIPFISLKSGVIIALTGKNDGKRKILK